MLDISITASSEGPCYISSRTFQSILRRESRYLNNMQDIYVVAGPATSLLSKLPRTRCRDGYRDGIHVLAFPDGDVTLLSSATVTCYGGCYRR